MGNKIAALKKKLKDINPFKDEWDSEYDEPYVDDYVPPPVRILGRNEWGARKPRWKQRLKTPVTHYILRSFSDTDYCWNDQECFKMMKQIQDKHMSMGMPDIAWNFLVGGNGTVYEGRGWTTNATKTDYQSLKYDGQTLDIALIGDFNDYHPMTEMNEAVCRLMRKGVELGHATEGWEFTELADLPPHAPWTPEYFMKNDVPNERIYDETTEPPPSGNAGGALRE